jgi:serine/threonine protein kinase/Tfp pilus assembly protein PilF
VTPDDFSRIKGILQEAMERDAGERATFLDLACAGDVQLRARVQALLDSEQAAGEFLSRPAAELTGISGLEDVGGLAPGRCIGPYQIVREVGHGGMGTVYLAERADGQYRKRVAIKLVNPHLGAESLVRRFRTERQVLANLEHANIAQLLDGGSTSDGLPYLVMEYVEGVPIDTWCEDRSLSKPDRLKLFRSVCAAVQYAHQRQVIHRDLKPGNILVLADGTPKVLDFGIAKVLNPDLSAAMVETTGLGPMTPEYASPEQIRGDRVGPASDIYTLGTVLYQLLTGRFPYSAQGHELAGAICEQQPQKPGLSRDLDNILLKALRKEPERRYASVAQLSEDIERYLQDRPVEATGESLLYRGRRFLKRNLVPVALSVALALSLVTALARFNKPNAKEDNGVRSIAVLPLDNLSGEKEQEYFADGITDALISDLARIRVLRVISRTSVMSYRGVHQSLPDIARRLGVNTIVEGSVLRAGNRVRISLRLVDGPKDRTIWSGSYEGELKDVLALQQRVAEAIAGEIHVTLTAPDEARISRSRRVDLGAYDAYLKGRQQYLTAFTRDSLQKAIGLFQQSLTLDPNYAPAYAGLADCYSTASNRYYPPTEIMPKAKAAVLKALEIDDTMGGAQATLALIQSVYEYDRAEAEKGFKRAIELDPSNPEAHAWYAEHLVGLGRFDEAVAQVEQAQKLDPVSPGLSAYHGIVLYHSHRYDQLIQRMQRLVEMYPNYSEPHFFLGEAYEQKGDWAKASAELGRNGVMYFGTLGQLGHVYAMSGKTALARKMLQRLKELSRQRYIESYPVAVLCAGLGDRDAAFAWLQKAAEDHSEDLALVNVDPRMNVLHTDSRYAGILRRVGLTQ